MHKRLVFIVLATLLLPTIIQLTAVEQYGFFLGGIAKILIHIGIPFLCIWYFRRHHPQFKVTTAILPPTKRAFAQSLKLAAVFGVGGAIAIYGSYVVLGPYVDFSSVIRSLSDNASVTASVFPYVALWVVLVNPFMEEFFWRGFVFGTLHTLARSTFQRSLVLFGTGIAFAIHHTIIITDWFNWWQYLLVVSFLAVVGIIFNWMRLKTSSILASLIIHTIADLVIVLIGFSIFY